MLCSASCPPDVMYRLCQHRQSSCSPRLLLLRIANICFSTACCIELSMLLLVPTGISLENGCSLFQFLVPIFCMSHLEEYFSCVLQNFRFSANTAPCLREPLGYLNVCLFSGHKCSIIQQPPDKFTLLPRCLRAATRSADMMGRGLLWFYGLVLRDIEE